MLASGPSGFERWSKLLPTGGSPTGGSLAPTVDANRRDDGPAIVHGRHGPFLTLAVALFCKVDVFKESEVDVRCDERARKAVSANLVSY